MKIDPEKLKRFILDADLLTQKNLEAIEKKALKEKRDLDDALLESGKISEEDLARLKAYVLGIPFVSLEKMKIDPKVLEIVPEPIARKNNIIAYKKTADSLEVAMLDPGDLETIEFVKKKSDLKIKPRLTNKESIKVALRQYQKSLEAEFGEIIKRESEQLTAVDTDKKEVGAEGLKKMAEDLPIIRIVDTLLRHAIIQRASDIHIEPLEDKIVVRYRIDGILHDAMNLPKHVGPGIIARVKVLAGLRLDEHRLAQDGRFKIELHGEKVSFRVSIFPVYAGEKAALRLLPENAHGFTLESLGFAQEALERIHRSIKKSTGMILATGPTGSGKTTTLYTIIDILNTHEVNISTLEDPIEYRIPRVNQTQVRPDIGFTFANGLRALVRQDPDIIMVGEIRDNETADLAVNAALTGHLLLSTLHTNSAAGAFPRLLEMKVEPFLLASTVNVVIAQRLVRKLCKKKSAYTLGADQIKDLGKDIDPDRLLELLRHSKAAGPKAVWKDITFYKPEKSDECEEGYKGRIGIHEVLEVSETIKNLVANNATSDKIEDQARAEGMITMFEDGIVKAAQGITSLEEVLRVTSE